MDQLTRRKAIKRILDDTFVEKTSLKAIDVLQCEDRDNLILKATIYDKTVDALIRLDRNGDGTYSVRDYAW